MDDVRKFRVGQVVMFSQQMMGGLSDAGLFTVERLLPMAGDEPQYRIKSETGPLERNARESELREIAASEN